MEPPASAKCASVVSNDNVHIVILLAELNYVDVISADIKVDYLNVINSG